MPPNVAPPAVRRLACVPIVLFALAPLAGCGARVTPPASVLHPTTVYVANYGRHTSVVLPTGPDTVTEYAYGDWAFFAEGHKDAWTGLRALVCSPQAAFGRHTVSDPHDPRRLARFLAAETVQPLTVEQDRAAALAGKLEARYRAHRDTEIYSPEDRMYLVKDPEHYALFHNSNMATAAWLRDLGCRVTGPAVLADFSYDPPAGPAATRPVR